jgi:class 3 adenylate cyclase
LTLPPRLEYYLSPDLWRRLTTEVPRRGVLLTALDRLRSILYLLSTYLPRHLVEEKMRRPVPGLVHGQMLSGSLLFSDVSGFTALSERLAFQDLEGAERPAPLGPKGAERLTNLMNQYFDRMIDIIAQSDGILLKFAGDALLVYFPEQQDGEQARWAVRAGQRMMRAIESGVEAASPETVRLQMKIGIGTGDLMAASVGSVERMEYVILGETVARTMAAESIAKAGQVVADEATAAYLDPGCSIELTAGFHTVRCDPDQALDSFEIKAERRRARGAIPLSAQPHAIAAQMEIALRQIEAIAPYLAAELVNQMVVRLQPGKAASEYRPATVLFLNVTGLETLLSVLLASSERTAGGDLRAQLEGPGRRESQVRQVTRLLNDYFQAMNKIIVQHGGVVSRIDPYRQGSKMLVLFGAPIAPEDAPLRAVSAALAMNDELANLNDRWRKQLGRSPGSTEPSSQAQGEALAQLREASPMAPVPCAGPQDWPAHRAGGHREPLLQQRIGITRGEVFAGQVGSATRREYTVMGDDVNLAARLMAAAQPGQILLSQWVYDAVVEQFSATALPPIQVKGKSQPIPIYQPIGPRDDPLARRLRSRGPLLGRGAELKHGFALLRQALAGQGMVLTITGPAGVGKSHLADTLAAHALARGARLFFTSCQSYLAHAPYAPWIALLQTLMGITPADDPDARREKLLRTLASLELPSQEYADPLCSLMGLPTISSSAMSLPSAAGQITGTLEARTAVPQASTPAKPALFAQLEQKVTSQEQKGMNLWQLVQDKRRMQPGQTWQTLQTRVAARRQERLFEAVGGLLACLSSDAPLLLMFESAQWMDTASQALLHYLGGRLQQLPILLLVLERSEGASVIRSEANAERPAGDVLDLEPLSQESTAALIHHLLVADGSTELAQALADTIYQQSGGNPLFVEEIVRWVQRSGHTAVEGLKGGPQASLTLQELMLGRLDILPHGQRDAVSLASIVGVEFLRGQVRALSTSPNDATLDEHLCGLESARLIILTHAVSDRADAQYAFRQTLVREVVYNSQSFARRRELHARMAAYVQACHADDLAQHAELLAHHYELGACFLPAARYLVLSGRKALQRYAYPQAADYYRRALATLHLLPAGEVNAESIDLKAQAHEGQGDVAVLTGDLAAAATAYEAAYAWLVGQAEVEVPARLLLKLAQVLPTQNRTAEAAAFAYQAWVMHAPRGNDLSAAATLAWILWRAGDAQAGDWIERARREASAAQGTQHADPWTAGIAALLTDLAGDWASAQRAYLALDQPTGAMLAACRSGDQYLRQGDVEHAWGLDDQAVTAWEREDDAFCISMLFRL